MGWEHCNRNFPLETCFLYIFNYFGPIINQYFRGDIKSIVGEIICIGCLPDWYSPAFCTGPFAHIRLNLRNPIRTCVLKMGSKGKREVPRNKLKRHKWKKGHSSSSNPTNKKFREAAKSRFFAPPGKGTDIKRAFGVDGNWHVLCKLWCFIVD